MSATLRSQIEGYTCLLIFRKISILPAIIWVSPFIYIQEKFPAFLFFHLHKWIFFICVGEKTGRLEIFLKIINGEAQITAGRVENFLKINKQVYPSIWDLRVYRGSGLYKLSVDKCKLQNKRFNQRGVSRRQLQLLFAKVQQKSA